MFFSTDLDRCAKPGDLVRILNKPNRPYKVTRRYKKKDELGQVYLAFEDTNDERVEHCQFWPCDGDTVLFNIAPYFDWLIEQRNIQSRTGNTGALAQIEKRLKAYGADRSNGTSWGGDITKLLRNWHVTRIEGDLAIVEHDGEAMKAPLRALLVLKKADGRIGR